MSQQINLLKAKTSPLGPTIWGLSVVAAALLGMVGYQQYLAWENAQLRETVSAGERKIAQTRMQKPKDTQAEALAIKSEIAMLKPRAEIVDQLVREVRSGNLGNPEGFSRHFGALGGVSEPGLWVTGVTVTRGGSAVAVTGRALRNESVMQYARRLNEAYSPLGVRFNSLEMAPDKPAVTGAPVVPSVTFKLS